MVRLILVSICCLCLSCESISNSSLDHLTFNPKTRNSAILVASSLSRPYDPSYIPNTIKDVTRLQTAFTQTELGLDSQVVINPSFIGLKTALYNSVSTLNSDSTLLFYYSGHGITENNRLFFIFEKDTYQFYVDAQWILQTLESALKEQRKKIKRLIMIVDSCQSGGLFHHFSNDKKGQTEIHPLTDITTDTYYNAIYAGITDYLFEKPNIIDNYHPLDQQLFSSTPHFYEEVLLVTAVDQKNFSFEEGDGGVFTQHLVNSLQELSSSVKHKEISILNWLNDTNSRINNHFSKQNSQMMLLFDAYPLTQIVQQHMFSSDTEPLDSFSCQNYPDSISFNELPTEYQEYESQELDKIELFFSKPNAITLSRQLVLLKERMISRIQCYNVNTKRMEVRYTLHGLKSQSSKEIVHIILDKEQSSESTVNSMNMSLDFESLQVDMIQAENVNDHKHWFLTRDIQSEHPLFGELILNNSSRWQIALPPLNEAYLVNFRSCNEQEVCTPLFSDDEMFGIKIESDISGLNKISLVSINDLPIFCTKLNQTISCQALNEESIVEY